MREFDKAFEINRVATINLRALDYRQSLPRAKGSTYFLTQEDEYLLEIKAEAADRLEEIRRKLWQ